MPRYESGRTRLTSLIEKKPVSADVNKSGAGSRKDFRLSRIADAAGYIRDFAVYLFITVFRKGSRVKYVLIGLAAAAAVLFSINLASDFKRVKALAGFHPDVTTRIYDRNSVLIAELFKQKREPVALDKVPEELVQAFIAVEDNEFYSHHGVNPRGILRAFFINLMAGGIRQGGSTITQQLSKILLTTGERSVFRKIKEACISVMIESSFSKDEIMEMYLNQIFLGHGAYGVEAAAGFYFGKHVHDCSLAECAMLASLPSAPNLLSPIRHPENSMWRHKIVLARMVECGFISVKQAEEAYMGFWPDYLIRISEMEPTATAWSERVNEAPWFTEYIRRDLIKKFGEDTVYNKGLMVYTTLDIRKQKAGQAALWKALKKQTEISGKLAFRNDDVFMEQFYDETDLLSQLFDLKIFKRRGSAESEKISSFFRNEIAEELEGLNFLAGTDAVVRFMDSYRETFQEDRDLQGVEGALISINHNNGYIEAMIGGSPFTSINQLNRVMQSRRQPGSSIKPLLYTAAIETEEYTAATPVLDTPIVYEDNDGGSWTPENYDGDFMGLVPLRKALALSINVISVRMAEKIGIGPVIDYYSKLLKIRGDEVKKRIPRNFSIALGSVEVSPFELTRAYAIIANGGRDVIPFSIRYITDRSGKIIASPEEDVKKMLEQERRDGSIQVLKPETACIMTSMLRTAVESGTGRSASPGVPAAGKTGTSNSWKDAWFVGFVPGLTTGIWIGYDRLGLSLGRGQTGGAVSAPVWGEYMRTVAPISAGGSFKLYGALEQAAVCDRTGFLPSPSCSTVSELFIKGTVPERYCSACAGSEAAAELPKKGPKENISADQKSKVLKSINEDKRGINMDDIGDDLLR